MEGWHHCALVIDNKMPKNCKRKVEEKGKGRQLEDKRKWEVKLWQKRKKNRKRPSQELNLVPSANALPFWYFAGKKNQAVPYHLANKSQLCSPDTHPDDAPVVYTAFTFDSSLRSDKALLGWSLKKFRKDLSGWSLKSPFSNSYSVDLFFISLPLFLTMQIKQDPLPLS